jgi:hypothetical protein
MGTRDLRTLLCAFVLSLAGLSPALASAQDTSAFHSGALVRAFIAPPGFWRAGTLVRAAPDTIVLRACTACAAELYARPEWTRLQVQISGGGSRSAHVAAGAFLAGALAAGYMLYHANSCHSNSDGPPCSIGTIAVPGVTALAAVVGAAVGGLFPADTWREVQRPRRADHDGAAP